LRDPGKMMTNGKSAIALYAGSFDPPTLGHLDIIRRAASVFGELRVAVMRNAAKKTLFTSEERVDMLRETVSDITGVNVDCFEGLLVDYLRQEGILTVVRGIRAYTDFESELQMALINRTLHPEMDTIFMLPSPEHGIISSTRVVEIASLGGDVSEMVPDCVRSRLAKLFPLQSS
jgi:pantetheine-phosphate adenylyltransferase